MSAFSRLSMGSVVGPRADRSGAEAFQPRLRGMSFGVGLPPPESERVGSGSVRTMWSIGFDASPPTAPTPFRSTSWALPWEQGGTSVGEVSSSRMRVVWSRRVGM